MLSRSKALFQLKQHIVEPDVHVVEIAGRLALGPTLQSAERDLQKLVADGARRVIVDLSELRSIDSVGVGMLMMISSTLAESGGQMRIAGAQGMVAQTFSVVHLDRVIAMYPDTASAVQDFVS